MTLIIALAVVLSFPVIYGLLRAFPDRRGFAFVAIGALPFLTNVTLAGYLYGWPAWAGTSRGILVPLLASIALALIATRARRPKSLPFWGLFLLYGLTVLFSAFHSRMWVASAFAIWQLILVALIFAAVGGESDEPKIRHSLWGGMALGLSYQAVFVIWERLTGVVQASGTMSHQNILGLTVELAAIPLVGALLAGYRSKVAGIGVAAALVCAAGSGSRATIGITAGVVVSMLIVSLIGRPTSRKYTIAALGFVALAAMTPFALATLNDRFHGGSFVTSEGERKAFETAARRMASDYPLGVGANQFVFVSNIGGYAAAAGVPWQFSDRSVPVHNAYLLARAETGWLGEISFILLLLVPTLRAFKFALGKPRSANRDSALGVAFALVANLIHNNYEFAVHTFPVQVLVVINLAVIAALLREDQLSKRQLRGTRNSQGIRVSRSTPSSGPAVPQV